MNTTDLPLPVQVLVQRGLDILAGSPPLTAEERANLYRKRFLYRKWRNLRMEAQFDIPECLWGYIDWNIPSSWATQSSAYTIVQYSFVIQVPGFRALAVTYKQFPSYMEWNFLKFEVENGPSSTEYEKLTAMLAIAGKLVDPRPTPVSIVDLGSDLLEGARAQKMFIPYRDADWGE